MDYNSTVTSYFSLRSLKLVPEIKAYSLVKGIDYPVEITNDNAPYALPYWHSQALARFILDNSSLFANKIVLDIGCGCGVTSIAAAMVGAKALALDPDLRCLEFTERNSKANNVKVDLVWGTHKTKINSDIILAAGVFHEPHGKEIATFAKNKPSLLAVSYQNLWNMDGFSEVAMHSKDQSIIHVFKSKHLF